MARPISPDTIPPTPGIYSIWQVHRNLHTENIAEELGQPKYWEECLYVGQASNLRNRINQHYLLLKYVRLLGEMKVKYKELPIQHLNMVEAVMIREFSPKLNQVGLPHARAILITDDEWNNIKSKF